MICWLIGRPNIFTIYMHRKRRMKFSINLLATVKSEWILFFPITFLVLKVMVWGYSNSHSVIGRKFSVILESTWILQALWSWFFFLSLSLWPLSFFSFPIFLSANSVSTYLHVWSPLAVLYPPLCLPFPLTVPYLTLFCLSPWRPPIFVCDPLSTLLSVLSSCLFMLPFLIFYIFMTKATTARAKLPVWKKYKRTNCQTITK